MKRTFAGLLMAVALTGPFVTQITAQQHSAVADIPFAFVVSHTTMPAGRYKVSQLNIGSATFLLADDRKHAVMVQLATLEQGAPDKPSVTFACYGNDRVLAKITPPGASNAYALSQSAIEKSLTHKLGMATMVSVKISAR
jgi:hypothetical protein